MLDPARLVFILVMGVVAITLLSLVANVLALRGIPHADKLQAVFSVDAEESLATWWSAITLAGLGLVTWCVGHRRNDEQAIQRWAWRLLAAGFVFLSMDEACKLHERIGGLVSVEGTFEHARWILLWLPLAAISASLIFWKLWRSSPRVVVGLIIGAGVFLTGAVGVETFNGVNRVHAEIEAAQLAESGAQVAGPIDRTGKANLTYVLGTAVEECFEMLGVVVWYGVLYGALVRMRTETEPAAEAEPSVPDVQVRKTRIVVQQPETVSTRLHASVR